MPVYSALRNLSNWSRIISLSEKRFPLFRGRDRVLFSVSSAIAAARAYILVGRPFCPAVSANFETPPCWHVLTRIFVVGVSSHVCTTLPFLARFQFPSPRPKRRVRLLPGNFEARRPLIRLIGSALTNGRSRLALLNLSYPARCAGGRWQRLRYCFNCVRRYCSSYRFLSFFKPSAVSRPRGLNIVAPNYASLCHVGAADKKVYAGRRAALIGGIRTLSAPAIR